jgi:hypothetical protein
MVVFVFVIEPNSQSVHLFEKFLVKQSVSARRRLGLPKRNFSELSLALFRSVFVRFYTQTLFCYRVRCISVKFYDFMAFPSLSFLIIYIRVILLVEI